MRQTLVRLAATAQDAELREWMRHAAFRTKDRARSHITSAKLCVDSLNYIKHTLPKPQSCDIIDINPGLGLWSEALHDIVQPRRHILVERNPILYEERLNPLLNRPNSRYLLAPDLDTVLNLDNSFFSAETEAQLKENEKTLSKMAYHDNVVNDTLLVTATLGSINTRIAGFNGSEAKRFINMYYRSIFASREMLHRYGTVRLLIWVDQHTRGVVMPTGVAGTSKQSTQLEASIKMNEVAGPYNHVTGVKIGRYRWYELEQKQQDEVLKMQEQRNIHIPEGRKPPRPRPPLAFYEPSTDFLRANRDQFPEQKFFVAELLALEEKLKTEQPVWFEKYQKEIKIRNARSAAMGRVLGKHAAPTGDEHRLFRLRSTQLRSYHNNFQKIRETIHKLFAFWPRLATVFRQSHPDRSSHLENTLEEWNNLKTQIHSMKRMDLRAVEKAFDDYRAMQGETPTLHWNRRTFEPLLTQPSEFHPPRRSLSLLDIQPNPDISKRLDTVEKQICFDYVVSAMRTNPGDTVMRGIKRVVPGGFDEFLSDIPDLKNPLKGGWPDLDGMRTRALNAELFIQIALAFEKWPYRPPIKDLIPLSALEDKLRGNTQLN